MNEATALHHEAMQLAEQADNAKRMGDKERAIVYLDAAFAREKEAALLVHEEPSRSVLLRSAASLALEYGNTREAERCIALALAGEPPVEIAEELRDLWEQAYFSRHLDLRGLTLDSDEFQMSIAGDDVGFGMAKSERFVRRIEQTQRLIHRTIERKANQEFSDTPTSTTKGSDDFEVYVTVPRAASLAVSFRIARPNDQEVLFPSLTPQSVVTEVLDCLSLLNDGKEVELRGRIADDAYYRSFVGIAKQIAPDGRSVKLVGFTASNDAGEQQRVAFKRQSKAIHLVKDTPAAADSPTTQYRGRLLFADDRAQRAPRIQIVSDDGSKRQVIHVPRGMMADVVRPLWEYEVVATCTTTARGPLLEDIRRASEDEE
jgi:hypothetical protein